MSNKIIIMIHGMWGGKWCWDNYKDFFEENGYQCIIPTLRHHECDPKDEPIPQLGTTSLLDIKLFQLIRNFQTILTG